MSDQTLNFRANTRLKDLIGRGLILNDNVAIIELIKNSSDANSPEVSIAFEQALTISDASQLVVQDFGEGMSLTDFKDKWLNIAFSGKRNQTNKGRAFAGEKGVGRFSCDRLGRRLKLISKSGAGNAFEAIVNWEDFELDDIDKEISSIDVLARSMTDTDYSQKVGHSGTGTRLEIEGLRGIWDHDKLARLKKELERFIIDPDKKFRVSLKSEDVKNKAGELVFSSYIDNRLFEKLDEKTTSVHSEISDTGKEIFTEIRHDGEVLLSFTRENPYSELRDLKIKLQIHYLNSGAKVSFKNITGYTSAEYGSVMMFLNGFRVMPYGDPDNDWLALNRRKTQGTSRYLGGREVFGRVEIYDDRRIIVPVTSREGVEINPAFTELATYDLGDAKRGFVHAAFLALETYVVRGLDWDRVQPKDGSYSYDETLKAMLGAVNQIENREKLTNVKIDESLVRKIAQAKIDEYDRFLTKLKKKVVDKPVYELSPAEKRDVNKFVDRLDARVQAAQVTKKEYKETAITEKKRRLFAEANQKPESKKNKELVHHMRLLGDKIGGDLKEAMRVLQSAPISERLKHQGVENRIHAALFNNEKLMKLARIVANADFDMMSDTLTEDVFSFVEQYVAELVDFETTFDLKISYRNPDSHKLRLSFSPIEVTMLVDNVLENAGNAKARSVAIEVAETDDAIELWFVNDGNRLSDRYEADSLFESGITTTSGSGIGLSQVRRISKALDAEATIQNNLGDGVSISIRWKK
jgi:signal transduction histidine kinase